MNYTIASISFLIACAILNPTFKYLHRVFISNDKE